MDKIARRRRDNLRRILEQRFEGNQADMAREIRRSPSTVWRLVTEGAHAKPIGEHLAREIEQELDLAPYWLDGMAQPLHNSNGASDVHPAAVPSVAPRAVPLFTETSALGRALNGPGGEQEIGSVFTTTPLSPGAWAMVVASDAMSPAMNAGDRVFIDPSVAPVPGDVVLAVIDHRQAVLRRLRAPSSQLVEFELVPANADYPVIASGTREIKLSGVVVEHHKIRLTRSA